MLLLAPALPLCLTGCGETRVERIVPPPERLTCAAQPSPPSGNTDREIASFIVDLVEAGQDCRDALAWIKDWSKQP
ncbi:Rz1-like lysis system protein LysC [Novosphingobium sp. Chol11]|uniref:Rz1-like lysis system protein LysC n=1 Tax=Novosphingobium sp. Chol11 TaxID=1385763 RepID=UPI003F905CF0